MNYQSKQALIQNIRVTTAQVLGKRYPELEKSLETLPIEALMELSRVCRDFEQKTHSERREGRKDVMVRGKMHL